MIFEISISQHRLNIYEIIVYSGIKILELSKSIEISHKKSVLNLLLLVINRFMYLQRIDLFGYSEQQLHGIVLLFPKNISRSVKDFKHLAEN